MKTELSPEHKEILEKVGNRIQLARLRRDLSMEALANMSGLSRGTLFSIEHGEEGVAFGALLRVLVSLGLESDLALIAKDDVKGRDLLEAQLLKKHNLNIE